MKVVHVHLVTFSNILKFLFLGIVTVQSAGNDHRDACDDAAGSPHVVTVGATGPNDMVSSFSNFGSCIDIFAPGEQLLSLDRGEHDAIVIC